MKTINILLLAFSIFATVTVHAQLGIGTTTPAASAQLEVSSNTRGFLPPRMDSAHRNAINSPAVGLIIYNTTTKGLEYWNGTNWYSTVHYIGEKYGGGIIFYVYDNGQHGLVAAVADQSAGIQWYNGTFRYTGTTGDGVGAGSMNTAMIVATQINDNQTGNFASKVCADYAVTDTLGVVYSDWYLPSIFELNLLYLQKSRVGGFANVDYWSSTEYNNSLAWSNSMILGNRTYNGKNTSFNVRAIRSF